nr:probable protein phosphatase 2C 12 [Tanacetum cinerariifolium]
MRKQIKSAVICDLQLSSAGGRLIIASDGVWDALSAEAALECCRGMPPDAAAGQVVKEAVQPKGLRDDTTCMVVDILPAEKINPQPAPQPKKMTKGVLKVKAMFRKKSVESTSQIGGESVEPDFLEEMLEEGSAMLSE